MKIINKVHGYFFDLEDGATPKEQFERNFYFYGFMLVGIMFLFVAIALIKSM